MILEFKQTDEEKLWALLGQLSNSLNQRNAPEWIKFNLEKEHA